jgi:drug/metabolite transporter (DMT)-like permease
MPDGDSVLGHDPARGAGLMTLAVISMVLIDVCAKQLVHHYPIHQILFFRGIFALLPTMVAVAMGGGLATLRVGRWMPHLLRAALGLIAMGSFFYALRFMTLIDATAIAMAAPLLITILSVPILGEQVGCHRWTAVVVGFIGVIIMLKPDPEQMVQPIVVVPLITALAYALLQVVTRQHAHRESTQAFVFTYLSISTLVPGVFCLYEWQPVEVETLPAVVGIGVAGGTMMLFMIQAYRVAQASFLAMLDYTALLWAAALGWLFWRELPSASTVAGGAILVAAGIYIVHRESRRRAR